MLDQDKKEITKLIKEEQASLDENISRLREITKPIPLDSAVGRISRMDAINNKAVNDRTLAQDLQRKDALEQALKNMEFPEYGICSRCKKPIPPMRLVYVPLTNVCAGCTG